MFAQILVISVVLISLAFAGIAIKILTKKDGEFKKTCGTTDPISGEKIGCACGSGDGGGTCENRPKVLVKPVKID